MVTVDVKGLCMAYGDHQVLRDLSIQVGEGEFLTLLGPSGCGKTTTLRCVAGLERPDGGSITIGGRVVASAAGRMVVPPNRRDIGMVFQSYALWPHMTVFANVAYPLKMRRTTGTPARQRVTEILEMVGMAPFAQRQVTELSGGQQQRVALARAMVARPGLLLFDEPLSNLDAKLRHTMRREIRAAHDAAGGSSIYVTHDQQEAITLSD
ncbi:MAG: ABC transporter ATP-binding protein, partial [Trebonia sp.]